MHGGWPEGLDAEVAKHVKRLEKAMGKQLGDPADPLLVSVRSGAKFSMPGMMDTVLNLGLNDESVEGLAKQTERRALRLRLLPPLHRHVRPHRARHRRPRSSTSRSRRPRSCAGTDDRRRDPGRRCSRDLVERLQGRRASATPGKPFPQDPRDQLRGAIEAVFRSWNGARAIAYRIRERIPHDLGTAVNVQTMVFGNRDDNSGTGVGFTRDPATGAQGAYGDFLVNAQGEDVVAGIRNTEPLSALEGPASRRSTRSCMGIFDRLETHYRDMCDTEFTIEQGKLWMLQTRVGKRTGAAALRMAVDMTKDRKIKLTKAEAVQRVTAEHLDQVLHPQFADEDAQGARQGPGRVAGRGGRARCTSPPTTRPTPPTAASRSSSCAARRHPRTCTA